VESNYFEISVTNSGLSFICVSVNSPAFVIPEEAGIMAFWIPAFAGMTKKISAPQGAVTSEYQLLTIPG